MWAYGDLRADVERRGTPIGSLDTMIAAHALSQHAMLVTNNARELESTADDRIAALNSSTAVLAPSATFAHAESSRRINADQHDSASVFTHPAVVRKPATRQLTTDT